MMTLVSSELFATLTDGVPAQCESDRKRVRPVFRFLTDAGTVGTDLKGTAAASFGSTLLA